MCLVLKSCSKPKTDVEILLISYSSINDLIISSASEDGDVRGQTTFFIYHTIEGPLFDATLRCTKQQQKDDGIGLPFQFPFILF